MHSRLFFFIIFFILTYQNTAAQDSIKTSFVFYREADFYAASIQYPIYFNDMQIGRIKNNSYFEYNCIPDIYTIGLMQNNDPGIRRYFEEGRTYYFNVEIQGSTWRPIPVLIEMDSVIAVQTIKTKALSNLVSVSTEANLSPNSLGLNLNFGAGFNPIPLVVLTTGEESTISFGGGFNFGLQYAHRINKKFELALDLNYQISSLVPEVSNASASFNRANIWATPSLIIPFKKNQMMNFKLGAGFNYNFLPTFKFDFSELGGEKGSWKYKEAFGFHTQLLFEINYSNLYTLNLGIRYVNLSYEFKPDNMYNPPVELQKPDGSAIDLLMGMAFHF